jgi:ABC-type multidrug transport system fused ATPase/permease subunit
MNLFKELNLLLTPKDRQFLGLLLFLSILVSLLETFGMSFVMVFVSVATNFNQITQNQYYSKLYAMLGASSPIQFVIWLGLAIIAFYLVRVVIGLAHAYLMSRFSYMRNHSLSTLIFNRFLRFHYQDFVEMNSAVVSQAIFSYVGNVTAMIFALLSLFSEIFTVTCIYVMLFFVNWKMTVVLTLFVSLLGGLMLILFSKSIRAAGRRVQQSSVETSKVYNESFHNFKIIKLNASESLSSDRFSAATLRQSWAMVLYTTLQAMPRILLETIGFLLIVGVILYVIVRYHNAGFVIPIVSLYALAFYRLLPSINKILTNYNQAIFNHHALTGIHEFLRLRTETLGSEYITFKQHVRLQDISFFYVNSKQVLHDASVVINKGDRVGFVGVSGSGKSTLVDIIMGLHRPSAGGLFVDDVEITEKNRRSLRQKIGYVPQTIYLFDGTVADNVVFGRTYNEAALIKALKCAHIYDFLLTKEGLATHVGDGGVKLSGGQKQRVAIARALYQDPEILVFDEATASLDHQTESLIMDEIYQVSSEITIVVVAHRISTVARCNKIYRIEHGAVSQVSFSDISQPEHRTIETTV